MGKRKKKKHRTLRMRNKEMTETNQGEQSNHKTAGTYEGEMRKSICGGREEMKMRNLHKEKNVCVHISFVTFK